jgi:hypothetical protein
MICLQTLDEEVNNAVKIEVERQPLKKRQNVSSFEIFEFFFIKLIYKKDEVKQKQFLEDLTLLIIKSHLLVHFFGESVVEAICFAIQFSHYLSFHKNVFTRDFARLGLKNKRCFYCTKIFSMCVNYYKF